MLSEAGYPCCEARLSVEEWKKALEKKAGDPGAHVSVQSCAVAFDSFALYFATGAAAGGGRFSTRNVDAALRANKLDACEMCATIDTAYLVRALSWLGTKPESEDGRDGASTSGGADGAGRSAQGSLQKQVNDANEKAAAAEAKAAEAKADFEKQIEVLKAQLAAANVTPGTS